MKKEIPQIGLPAIEELKNNSIGNAENDKARIKAICVLDKAKQIEEEKIKNGFVWMVKDKTSKLVNPERIKEHKLQGFKTFKKIK